MSDPLGALVAERARQRKKAPSTLADSLVLLSGGNPPRITISSDADDVGGGEYNPRRDEMFLSPEKNRNPALDPARDVMMHEFGHRYDEGPGSPKGGRLRSIVPAGKDTTGDEPGQYQAIAFQKAVRYLQDPVSRDKRAKSELDFMERSHPGTRAVVEKLLSDPLYSEHPLRSQSAAQDSLTALVASRAQERQSRGIRAGLEDVGNAIRHPVETIKSMGNAISEGLNKASSPVIGMPTNLLRIPGRPTGKVTAETPGAVTPAEFAKGAGESALNIGFALAPQLALPARAGVNAALGALHSPEDRTRGATAGLVLGEVLHGTTKLPGKIAGRLRAPEKAPEPPVIEAGGKKFIIDATTKRRPGPVEPPPDAQTYSTKGKTIRRPAIKTEDPAPGEAAQNIPLIDDLAARRVGMPQDLADDINLITEEKNWKRTITTKGSRVALPDGTEGTVVEFRHPKEGAYYDGQVLVEHPFTAENGDVLPNAQRWYPATKLDAVASEPQTAHFPPEPDITPVASSNGEFETRPGVLRKVNRELTKAGPEPSVTIPRIKAGDVPDTTPRITVDEANKRTQAAIEAERARQEKQRIRRSKWAPGESIRDEAGALRKDLTNVPDEVLEAELQRIHELNVSEEAAAAAVKEANYRDAYNELPRTERLGRKGQEDLPDADGMVDAERLASDNKTLSEYNKNTIIRAARARAVARLEAELAARKPEKYKRIGDEEETFDDSFDFGSNIIPKDASPSDTLNISKLNLADKSAEQRIMDQLEVHRALRDDNRQTFAEADVKRAEIVKDLLGGDMKALRPAAAKKLSGEELLARRDVVSQNDNLISELSKAIESKSLSVAEHEQATALLQKAIEHNDALLSDLVTGSSQKGRDLNLLRRIANRDLDPATWQIQAKRMLGDRPLTDEISATIRKLAQEAMEACR